MINPDHFHKIIYQSQANIDVSKAIQKTIFEYCKHNLDDLLDVDFTNIDCKATISETNVSISSYQEYEDIDEIYLSASSSAIYNILLSATIPTLNSSDIENPETHGFIYKLRIKLNDDISAYDKIKVMSCLSSLWLNPLSEIIVHQDIFDYIHSNFNEITEIDILSKTPVFLKKLSMSIIKEDFDILSLANQSMYQRVIHSILSSQTKRNTSKENLNSLQHYLIEQQIRFKIFLTIESMFDCLIPMFKKRPLIIDPQGFLFFSVCIPLKQSSDMMNFPDLFFSFLEYGIFPSLNDANTKVCFDVVSDTETTLPKPFTENHLSMQKSPLYPILFRLLDENLSNNLEVLDTAITSSNTTSILKELKKLY